MVTREDIIHDILRKKELQGIEHAFAATVLEKELRKQPKLDIAALSARSSAYKNIVKAVRAVLRRNVGLFEGDPRHRETLLAELRQAAAGRREEIITHLLSTHASTQERLPFYDRVYGKIFAITGKPGTVLDIGCGLNPLSYPDHDAVIIGVDIDRGLCATVQEYFSITGIQGECKVADVRGIEKLKLPQADVALVFKLLDLLEQKGTAAGERLLAALPACWLVVSFPTQTMSGRPMRVPRRPGFEAMLKRKRWTFTVFTIPNEIFYVVRKQ